MVRVRLREEVDMTWKRMLAGGVTIALVLTMVDCGGDEESTVAVTLQEFSVSTEPTSAAAGSITFDATNDGPDDQHEFVVIKTDLALTELPTDENGAVEEDGEGIEVIDEIEPFDVGETESLTVDLDAGAYVLICNIFDEEENEAHYQEGMRTSFTVE
jgi:uncharacterized cupredoxin-like copper-binding protein